MSGIYSFKLAPIKKNKDVTFFDIYISDEDTHYITTGCKSIFVYYEGGNAVCFPRLSGFISYDNYCKTIDAYFQHGVGPATCCMIYNKKNAIQMSVHNKTPTFVTIGHNKYKC